VQSSAIAAIDRRKAHARRPRGAALASWTGEDDETTPESDLVSAASHLRRRLLSSGGSRESILATK